MVWYDDQLAIRTDPNAIITAMPAANPRLLNLLSIPSSFFFCPFGALRGLGGKLLSFANGVRNRILKCRVGKPSLKLWMTSLRLVDVLRHRIVYFPFFKLYPLYRS